MYTDGKLRYQVASVTMYLTKLQNGIESGQADFQTDWLDFFEKFHVTSVALF